MRKNHSRNRDEDEKLSEVLIHTGQNPKLGAEKVNSLSDKMKLREISERLDGCILKPSKM
ncbi:hypothetical protein TU61_13245 [Bacillus cereus]|nr:hypothetical protein DY470_06725 [Bacillus anthracis]KMP66723.1 hypothetical protein TU61_13245 [Bacillus cereus]OJD94731.1 hypothetical protein A9486_04580 [Bacillus anthracis]